MSELGALLDIFVAFVSMTLPPESVAQLAPDPETHRVLFGAALALLLASVVFSTVSDALDLEAGAATLITVAICLLAGYGLRTIGIESFVLPYGALVLSLRFIEGAALGHRCGAWARPWHWALLLVFMGAGSYGLSFVDREFVSLATLLWAVLGASVAAVAVSNSLGAAESRFAHPFFRVALVATLLSTQLFLSSTAELQLLHIPSGGAMCTGLTAARE